MKAVASRDNAGYKAMARLISSAAHRKRSAAREPPVDALPLDPRQEQFERFLPRCRLQARCLQHHLLEVLVKSRVRALELQVGSRKRPPELGASTLEAELLDCFLVDGRNLGDDEMRLRLRSPELRLNGDSSGQETA